MMGSGKSSVGKVLARLLDLEFIDTDSQIESDCGVAVAEIFAREGEDGFRRRERAVLDELPDRGAVVALGGGAIVSEENRAILSKKGTLVCLDIGLERLVARLAHTASRPLLAGLDAQAMLERLREIAQKREAAYAAADLRVSTDELNVNAVAHTVLEALREHTA